MRIALATLLSSPAVAPFVDLIHVEALLLLPRNQLIRQRFKALYREYNRVLFNHTDPYAEDRYHADCHPDVIAARRPITAIELMLTDGRHQGALANYRRACAENDRQEMGRIEQILATIVELRPHSRTAEPLHAVG